MTMSRARALEGDDSARTSSEGASDEPVVINGQRYLRAPVPVHFPEYELVPETKRHLEQRTMLYQVLKLAFGERAAIGCDQFVYWDPTNPRQCLAPDGFVRLGVRDEMFRTWKVWERGAPEVAIEIISSIDARDRNWGKKLESYRRLGVRELVRFDPECEPVSLRIWDAIDQDLVERNAVERSASSRYLPGVWLVVEDPEQGSLLRLSHDGEGQRLYPTPAEHVAQEAERVREEAERVRQEEAAARVRAEQAEQRVRELEAELKRRG